MTLKVRRAAIVSLLGAAVVGAASLGAGLPAVAQTKPAGKMSAPILFRDASSAAGIADVAVNATGPAFADFDEDGDIDIHVPVEDLSQGLNDRLWRNDGKGVFTDVAAQFGIAHAGSLSRGAAWGDYDNDGDQDLALATMPSSGRPVTQVPTSLFKNLLKETGKPAFENVTRKAGLMRKGNANDEKIGGVGDTGAGVGWGDYDNDGDLDLYWKCADSPVENALFRNNGDGTFTEVTDVAGVNLKGRVERKNSQGSPNWSDFDQDGKIDLLVTNEADSKVFFRNNGDGTFADITRSRKPPSAFPFTNPGNTTGACVADVDNDGDFDVYLANADQANRLILNRLKEAGALTFEDVTMRSGAAGRASGARGCVIAVFDNDGWQDIYVNNGGLSNVLINDVLADFPPFVQFYIAWEPAENLLLRNNGNGTFTEVTQGSGAESLGIGSGVGAADVNEDGFPDLFVTNRTYYSGGKRVSEPGQNRLFLGNPNANHWVRIDLRGRQSNRNGYGARVKIVAGELVQHREHTSAHGYNSTNDPRLLVGLGNRQKIDEIEVTWPSGVVQKVKNPKARTTVRVVEPEARK